MGRGGAGQGEGGEEWVESGTDQSEWTERSLSFDHCAHWVVAQDIGPFQPLIMYCYPSLTFFLVSIVNLFICGYKIVFCNIGIQEYFILRRLLCTGSNHSLPK